MPTGLTINGVSSSSGFNVHPLYSDGMASSLTYPSSKK